MKNVHNRVVSFLLTLSIVPALFFARGVSAALQSQTPQGITVSPASQQVTINPDEQKHEIDFSITNHRPSAQTLKISAADFNTLGETGGLVFVGSNPTQLQKKYGLAKWISLPQSIVTIQPGQTEQVKAYVLNLPSLAPGGHYGALMFRVDTGSVQKNAVGLSPIASSLLFVNKTGGDIHKLKLSNVYVSHDPFIMPSSVLLRFYNDGNTHLVPRGTVTISDPSGKVVSKGIINENSDIILPQTYRRYPVELKKTASSSRLGYYKLSVNFRFDGYAQYRIYSTSLFQITPTQLAIAAVLLAIIIAAVVLAYRRVRQAKKRGFRNHRQ